MKNSIACMCLLLCSFWGYSQISATQYDTPAIIPQSPEVSSLLRYSEVPVSYYNGIPNVGVPIYTLQGRELSAPINLSYHAGGHRVNEEAGWVGLGWSLATGGQISRTVKGYPDDTPNGFINLPYTVGMVKQACNPESDDPPLNDPNQQLEPCAFYTNTTAITNRYDYEPDDFNYSMFGQSGRFMFNQNRSAANPRGEVVQFPNKNVIITPTINTSTEEITGWTIIDTNGTKYEFETGNRFIRSDSFQRVGGAMEVPEEGGNGFSYTETWNLTKVTSVNGDIITLQYNTPVLEGYPVSTPYNDVTTTEGSQSLIIFDGTQEVNDRVDTYTITKRHYKLISKISTTKGSVEFVPDLSNRLDTQSSKQRLKYIQVFNTENEKLQEIELVHNYFQSTITANNEFITGSNMDDSFLNKRLYLDKVIFKGFYNGYNPLDNYSYSFGYNTEVMLPHRRSYAQDHWGYYNGINNTNLIPYSFQGNAQKANREVNPALSSACILNRITYPEGGITKLSYENNRGDIKTRDIAPYAQKEVIVKALASYNHTITENSGVTTYVFKSNNFTISNEAKPATNDITKVQASYNGFSNRCDTEDALYTGEDMVCDTMFFKLYKVDGATEELIETYSIWESGYELLAMGGTYRFEIVIESTNDAYNMIEHYSEVTFSWLDDNPDEDAEVFDYFGGVRVSEIKTYDKKKLTSYKSFDYAKGYVISTPEYFSISANNIHKIVSQSSVPLITTQAGYVGYRQVVENIHQVATETGYSTLGNESSETRKIHREFSHFPDTGEYVMPLPGAPYAFEWVAGRPIFEEIVGKNSTSTGYLILEEKYTSNRIFGLMLSREYKADHFSPDNLSDIQACMSGGNCDMSRNLYDVWPGQLLNNNQTVITKEGTRELQQVTNTYYESVPNHHNPTKTKFTDSKGDVYETVIQYPYEENHTALLDENRLGVPLKTKQYKGTTLMQTAVTQYSGFTGSDLTVNPTNLLLQSMSGAKKTNTLEERIKYHDYTPYGQVREVSKTDGTHITYLWGYNYNYPVAKIENATYAQVSAVVNEVNIQNLTGSSLDSALASLRDALPQAMVSTYIFEPLIGMTQSTDPRGRNTYYKYDGTGRLKYVLDHDQHVLSENNYHYKNN